MDFSFRARPKDSGVLTSSSLIRRLVRACVPRWSQMLPPKLYLVIFLPSDHGEPDKDDLFRIQKTFGSACYIISHVHTPWGSCNKML